MLFKNCCLEEAFLLTCAFSKKKVHSLSVAPEPLAIWNKKLEGLESESCRCFTTDSLPWGYPGPFVRASAYAELDGKRKR